MTHVVTGSCTECRFTECVSVCPVECFHFDGQMTYIDPDVCIDCAGCIPVCPVNAIFDAVTLTPELDHWIEVNRTRSKTLPVLTARMEPLPTAPGRRRELGFDGALSPRVPVGTHSDEQLL